jgi:hypothetical protein
MDVLLKSNGTFWGAETQTVVRREWDCLLMVGLLFADLPDLSFSF